MQRFDEDEIITKFESFVTPTRGDWAARDLPDIPCPTHESPHFRAVRNKSVIDRLEERRECREKAIQDLVDSESQYNVLLGLLISHYVSPLSDYKTINSKQHKTLFPALESIKELSDKFLHELKQRRRKWQSNITKLSDLFDTFTPFFRMYQHHVNNQEKALDLLQQLSQNKRWIVFCQKAQIHCQRIPLSDLLILPSEQLVKYDDALSTIVAGTSMHHPDYTQLIKSQESLHHEVESMKLKMVEYNRKENVRKMERRFKGNIDLLEPHRSFVCEGKLWKVSARSTKDRIYTFFLFNDLLIYASPFGTNYKIHNMLPINDRFQVEIIYETHAQMESYGMDKKDRLFCIKSEKKSIVVYADTVPLAQQWVRQLKQCISEQLAPVQTAAHRVSRARQFARIPPPQTKRSRHTKSVGEYKTRNNETLPVWVPDSHVTNCSICDNKFTFTLRKHHCRKCGAVVCSKCSKYKILNGEGVKQRACKRCFAINNMGQEINPNKLQMFKTPNQLAPGPHHPSGNRAKSLQLRAPSKYYKRSMTQEDTSQTALFFDIAASTSAATQSESDASDFENEVAALYALPYYVETGAVHGDYTQIFSKFGHGIGSYMLIPSAMDFDEYYSVHLVVQTASDLNVHAQNGFELFKISLFEKQRRGMVFRLEKKSHKTRDFASMDKLLRYLQQKENLKFEHAIYRSEVEKTVHHSIKHIYVADMERYPKAQALYDYESKDDADLTFKAGDTICVWDKSNANGGWWRGVIGDRVGLFPSNYVQLYGAENYNHSILDEIEEEPEEVGMRAQMEDPDAAAYAAYHAMNVMSGVYDELVDQIELDTVDATNSSNHYHDGSTHYHHGTVIEHMMNNNNNNNDNNNNIMPNEPPTVINYYNSTMTMQEYVDDQDDIKVAMVGHSHSPQKSDHSLLYGRGVNHFEDAEMDGATRYFYIFLRNNKLDQYFEGFKAKECCDIRDIEYLMDDGAFLKNEIGIQNLIHRRKLMGEFRKLKEKMDEFKNSNLIPHVLVDKLAINGIVTMDLLCSQCENRHDLTRKFNIHNENQLNLLWNIIDIQINPNINYVRGTGIMAMSSMLPRQRTERTEGCEVVPVPPAPVPPPPAAPHADRDEDEDDKKKHVQNDSDAASIIKPARAPAKIVFITPEHVEDEEGSMDTDGTDADGNNDDDNNPPPPPPPAPAQ